MAELFYIYFFAQIVGEEQASIVAAGVMLYRVFQWALPIPVGWGITWRWRRKINRGELPDPFAASPDQPASESWDYWHDTTRDTVRHERRRLPIPMARPTVIDLRRRRSRPPC